MQRPASKNCRCKGPDGAVTGIRFNTDGMLIASSMLDDTGTLKLWGPARGQRTSTLKARVDPLGMIYGMIPQPKPAKGGHTTPSIAKPHFPMTTVALSPDGKRIVGGNLGIGVLTVWDTTTGQEIVTLGRGDIFDAMVEAFSPDSKRIVVGCQGMVLHNHATLTVWDATSGTQSLAPERAQQYGIEPGLQPGREADCQRRCRRSVEDLGRDRRARNAHA